MARPAFATRSTSASSASRSSAMAARYPALDAARGVALFAMFAYHFAFDLDYFRLIEADPYDSPLWIACRTLILGSFLLLVGVGLVLANRDGIRWRAVSRRFAQIAACALLVSVGSYLVFPESWIWFGVLHHIAVASLLGLLFLRLHWLNLWLGIGMIIAGAALRVSLFDAPGLSWIGLVTAKPITEDYAPLLPWFGVVLVGMFLGRSVMQGWFKSLKTWQPMNSVSRLLALAGRHSLLLYMVHQPVFIGVLSLVTGQSK